MLLVQNVSRVYRLYRKPSDRILEMLQFGHAKLHTDFWALKHISFTQERGEFVALVGPNGCGKSTLLQVVSGILRPTEGSVLVQGRVAALLELGAGFNPDFTGRENVMINGELLGLSRAEMHRALPRIEEFAGIGAFIDRPMKEYSSGMYVRLAFSTAIHVEPELLIVDEALAVGDAAFAIRCIHKFRELREQGVSVLFVSHDLGLVKQLADRALFLLHGELQAQGDPKMVIDRYIASVLEAPSAHRQESTGAAESIRRHGDLSSEILKAELVNAASLPTNVVATGDLIAIRVSCRFHRSQSSPTVGILLRNRIGIDIYGTNTRIQGVELGSFAEGDRLDMEFRFNCWLTPQQYSITVATQNENGGSNDWLDDAIVFDVVGNRQAAGIVDLRADVSWEKS